MFVRKINGSFFMIETYKPEGAKYPKHRVLSPLGKQPEPEKAYRRFVLDYLNAAEKVEKIEGVMSRLREKTA